MGTLLIGSLAAGMVVVTWNISPAPSQSEAVIIGVWMYWKPRSWKKRCVAYARLLRIRITAEMVLVRPRMCAMSRKYSFECFFFAS